MLGSDDQPLPGVTVAMTARLVDRGREYPPGTPDFEKQYAEFFSDRTGVTDAKGYFVIAKTPQRMELSIWLTRSGETNSALAGEKYFEPGQTRPAETIRLAAGKAKPLELEVSNTLRDCRLAGTHALVIVCGAGDAAASFTKAHLFPETNDDETAEENEDVYSYLTLFMSGPEAAKEPDRRAYLTARNWPLPEPGSLFLAAMNRDGKELGRLSVNVSNDQAAAKEVAAFIKTHLPRSAMRKRATTRHSRKPSDRIAASGCASGRLAALPVSLFRAGSIRSETC